MGFVSLRDRKSLWGNGISEGNRAEIIRKAATRGCGLKALGSWVQPRFGQRAAELKLTSLCS